MTMKLRTRLLTVRQHSTAHHRLQVRTILNNTVNTNAVPTEQTTKVLPAATAGITANTIYTLTHSSSSSYSCIFYTFLLVHLNFFVFHIFRDKNARHHNFEIFYFTDFTIFINIRYTH